MNGTKPGAASKRKTRSVAVFLVFVAIIGAALFFALPKKQGPPPAPVPADVAPATPGAGALERGDQARALIADMRASGEALDLARVHDMARSFHSQKYLADAYLLFFYAAREGHGPSALVMGTMYDPMRSSGESLVEQPIPSQALKWYRQAGAAGVAEADERLAGLKAWAEEAAAGGDTEARRLLVNWP